MKALYLIAVALIGCDAAPAAVKTAAPAPQSYIASPVESAAIATLEARVAGLEKRLAVLEKDFNRAWVQLPEFLKTKDLRYELGVLSDEDRN